MLALAANATCEAVKAGGRTRDSISLDSGALRALWLEEEERLVIASKVVQAPGVPPHEG